MEQYAQDSAASRRLRRMYAGGKGDAVARRYARLWGWAFGLGLFGSRWVTLEVPGRRTGATTSFPLGICRHDGAEYLVAMLGECNWSRNVRANGGRAVLRRRRPEPVLLTEVPAAQRPPIIKSYLQQVPGGRPHIPVSPEAPVAEFDAVAPGVPVFRIVRGAAARS